MRSKMAILSFSSVLLAILIGGSLLIENVSLNMEKEISRRALAIARTVAQMSPIQENVGRPGGEGVIQPMVEKIRLATAVEYIIVYDMNLIRYSHPLSERIGQTVTGEDVNSSLANNEYISKAEGVNGPSVRAFVPIKVEEGNRQVGVAMVGILTPTITALLSSIRMELYSSLALGIIVGLMGAAYLARNVKKAMMDLEPEEIARLLEERIAIVLAMDEGVVAVNQDCRITVINDRAKELLGIDGDPVGKDIREVSPETTLPKVVETGEPEYNMERWVGHRTILATRLPIRVKGKIVGAFSMFRDKTEVNRLAEELTGVRTFIDALRAQNHEHLNKLHTIAGLIQLSRNQEAMDYIFDITEEQEELTRFLGRNIKEYAVAGLLLGKYNRAKERKIRLEIDSESRLTKVPANIDVSGLVIIIGNLLENAMDAVTSLEEEQRLVYFLMEESDFGLTIEVEDQGIGILQENLEKIFTSGFSTKGSSNHGIGLALVKRIVDSAGGTVEVSSRPGCTIMTVYFPYSDKIPLMRASRSTGDIKLANQEMR